MALSKPKPWAVSDFESERPHMTGIIKVEIIPLLDNNAPRVLVKAPVKSGKREIPEYLAMRDLANGRQSRVHAFVSAWHRKSDQFQRDELKQHNMEVFSIINKVAAEKCIRWINEQLLQGKRIIIHFDECDHGTGDRQLMSRVWREIRDSPSITTILYSATPEEALVSDYIVDEDMDEDDYQEMMNSHAEGFVVSLPPPEGFCGPAKFLEEGLVFEATPFFHKIGQRYTLSDQGRQIIADMKQSMLSNPTRNILKLRLTYSMEDGKKVKDNKAIYHLLKNWSSFPELADAIIIGDKDEKFKDITPPRLFIAEDIQWSNPGRWEALTIGKPVIILVDQTCSRSTELSFHNRLFAVHDFRNTHVFATYSQAIERVNHYSQKYGGEFQPIRIYGHVKTLQLSAGVIPYADYLSNPWIKRKVDRRISGNETPLYHIRNQANEIHPIHTESVSLEEADRILIDLGCGSVPTLSVRVKGGIQTHQEIDCTFYPCTRATYPDLRSAFPAVRFPRDNPFIKSDIEMARFPDKYDKQIGHLRGWKVFEFQEVEENSRWGFGGTSSPPSRATICYREGVLGIALRSPSGEHTTTSTLQPVKSMYSGRASR